VLKTNWLRWKKNKSRLKIFTQLLSPCHWSASDERVRWDYGRFDSLWFGGFHPQLDRDSSTYYSIFFWLQRIIQQNLSGCWEKVCLLLQSTDIGALSINIESLDISHFRSWSVIKITLNLFINNYSTRFDMVTLLIKATRTDWKTIEINSSQATAKQHDFNDLWVCVEASLAYISWY